MDSEEYGVALFNSVKVAFRLRPKKQRIKWNINKSDDKTTQFMDSGVTVCKNWRRWVLPFVERSEKPNKISSETLADRVDGLVDRKERKWKQSNWRAYNNWGGFLGERSDVKIIWSKEACSNWYVLRGVIKDWGRQIQWRSFKLNCESVGKSSTKDQVDLIRRVRWVDRMEVGLTDVMADEEVDEERELDRGNVESEEKEELNGLEDKLKSEEIGYVRREFFSFSRTVKGGDWLECNKMDDSVLRSDALWLLIYSSVKGECRIILGLSFNFNMVRRCERKFERETYPGTSIEKWIAWKEKVKRRIEVSEADEKGEDEDEDEVGKEREVPWMARLRLIINWRECACDVDREDDVLLDEPNSFKRVWRKWKERSKSAIKQDIFILMLVVDNDKLRETSMKSVGKRLCMLSKRCLMKLKHKRKEYSKARLISWFVKRWLSWGEVYWDWDVESGLDKDWELEWNCEWYGKIVGISFPKKLGESVGWSVSFWISLIDESDKADETKIENKKMISFPTNLVTLSTGQVKQIFNNNIIPVGGKRQNAIGLRVKELVLVVVWVLEVLVVTLALLRQYGDWGLALMILRSLILILPL
jgi:hypothetical protein